MFRALHDDIGGLFTGVGLELELLRLEVLDRDHGLANRIGDAQRRLDEVFEKIRALSYEAHPDPVARFGFEAAMNGLLTRFRRRCRGEVKVSFTAEGGPPEPFARDCYDFVESLLDNLSEEPYSGSLSFSTYGNGDEYSVVLRDDGDALARALAETEICSKHHSYLTDTRKYRVRLHSRRGHGTIIELNGQRGNKTRNAD